MSVFDKIMAVRQASFKDGEITLFNERVTIVPEESIIFITDYLIKNKDKIPEFYDGIRKSVYDGWANNIRKTYNFDKDPRKFKSAKPIREIRWKNFRRIIGNKWKSGLKIKLCKNLFPAS